MRWINVLTFAILVLISGCKEEVGGWAASPGAGNIRPAGGKVGLERWRGKAVYLNFWSAGCGGCLAEMDALEALSKKVGR